MSRRANVFAEMAAAGHAITNGSAAMETEHARLLQQGWRLDPDGCYRMPAPAHGIGKAP
jgi:hypothetical protein